MSFREAWERDRWLWLVIAMILLAGILLATLPGCNGDGLAIEGPLDGGNEVDMAGADLAPGCTAFTCSPNYPSYQCTACGPKPPADCGDLCQCDYGISNGWHWHPCGTPAN